MNISKTAVASVALTTVLLVPASAAAAGPPAGTRECPPGEGGIVVWVQSPTSGTTKDVVKLCFYTGP